MFALRHTRVEPCLKAKVPVIWVNRRKEPLEAYPIDSMAMVGRFMRNGRQYALLRVDEDSFATGIEPQEVDQMPRPTGREQLGSPDAALDK